MLGELANFLTQSRTPLVGGAALAIALWVQLLRMRFSWTKRLGQYWFGLCVVVAFLLVDLIIRIIGPCLSRLRREEATLSALGLALNVVFALNPHIRIKMDANWKSLPPKAIMLMPHLSWIDVLIFASNLPLAVLKRTRGLFKVQLTDAPVCGPVIQKCGHFPVHFKKDEDGAWGLDHEKQAPVTERIEEYLSGKAEKKAGYLGIFPEGTINKTPPTLQTFRRGAFDMVLNHNLPVWAFVMVGNELVWPNTKNYQAGAPGDIDVAVVPLVRDPSSLPAEQQTKEALSELCRERMQVEIDRIVSSRSSR